MTTEDLMKLADTYARCNANYHVENLYGTSGSYTEDCARQQQQARQALLDALEALGREVARLREVNAEQYGALDLAARECTTLRAELAAIRATDKGAGLVAALKDAATSLETISRLAGRTHYVGDDGERVETYMGRHDEVRGYATSRASKARAALSNLGGV